MIGLIEWVSQTKIDKLASLATLLGVFAILIAWIGLKKTWRTERASHMNTLFREFLRLEFDFFNANCEEGESKDKALDSLASYKMWVLEEIWMWTDENRHKVFILRPESTNRLHRAVENWHATLEYHLHRNASLHAWEEFWADRKCYHAGFVEFAERWNPHSPLHRDAVPDCKLCKRTRSEEAQPADLSAPKEPHSPRADLKG